MPSHLEKIRDRLAENIHELWGMNKIELGWTFGKVCVPVARPRRRVGLPCSLEEFCKDLNEEGNLMSQKSLLLTATCPASTVFTAGLLGCCSSAVRQAKKTSSAQTDPGINLVPSYLHILVSCVQEILRVVVPQPLL